MSTKVPKALRSLPFLQTESALIRQWCRAVGFLYFTDSSHLPAGAGLVRGATLMPGATDTHICVGEYNGRDVTLLRREVTLSRFEKQPVKLAWHIIEMECATYRLPRLIADKVGRNDVLYHELISLNWPMVRWEDPRVMALKKLHDHGMLVFCRGGWQHELEAILTEDMTAGLLAALRLGSVEWEQERLVIASSAKTWQQSQMASLLEYAEALAGDLENIAT